jgi:hypothetical protein
MSLRYRALVPSLLLICASLAMPAFAGIPDPAHCTVPPCLVLCPAGDDTFTVVVRDIAGNPVSGVRVRLEFASCSSGPSIVVCSWDCCPGLIIDGLHELVRTDSDANGVAKFGAKMGGLCEGSTVGVSAGSVHLADVHLASPDQNGNLVVGADDAQHVHDLIGTTDPGADFDCDGIVTQADYDWLVNNHGGHSCAGIVPARTPSWGSVKVLYR